MKRIFALIIFSIVSLQAFCQLIPVTDQYLLNPMLINPSYAGGRSALSASLIYRNQWLGMEGAPETGTFSIDAPFLSKRVGVGLIFITEKFGVTREKQIITNYAFRLHLGQGLLSMGLGADIVITNSAWSDLIVNDPGDEQYLVDSRTLVVPDFRFGLYYTYKDYFAGFSIPKLLSYSFDFNKNKYVLNNNINQYNYLLTTGYTFSLSKKVTLSPSALLSYLPSEGFSYHINAQVGYADRFWLGASYRSSKAVAGLFHFKINNQLGVAYAYTYNLSSLGKYNTGSHEIMVRYEFHYKVDAVNPLEF